MQWPPMHSLTAKPTAPVDAPVPRNGTSPSPSKARGLAELFKRRKEAPSSVRPLQVELVDAPVAPSAPPAEEQPTSPTGKLRKSLFNKKPSAQVLKKSSRAGSDEARPETAVQARPSPAARLDVTVVEARAVAAGMCFFRVNVEGAVGSTASLEGPDAIFLVAASAEDPYPNHNHFAMEVMDVAQAAVHVMLFDDEVDSGALVACGSIPVSRLLRFGGSIHEETVWLALTDPQVTYFPTRQDLAGLYQLLHPAPRRRPASSTANESGGEAEQSEPPTVYGYVQVRLHLHMEHKASSFRSLLLSPPIADCIPAEAQKKLVPFDPVLESVARVSLLASSFFAVQHAWRGLAVAALPFWWHVCFSAHLWEFPLSLIVLPTLALTVWRVVQTASKSTQRVVREAALLSRQDYVAPAAAGHQSEPMRRLSFLVARVLGSLLPLGEKLHSAFSFAVLDLSLMFVAGALLFGVGLIVLMWLFDDAAVVFCVGLLLLGPLAGSVVVEAMLGKPVHVYQVSFLQARNLAAVDVAGTSDPFCRIPDMLDVTGAKVKTPVAKKMLAPVWNSTFKVALSTQFHYSLEPLSVAVHDDDYGIATNYLGRVQVQKSDFQFANTKWFPLVDGQGELELGLVFLGNTYDKFVNSANPYWREWAIVKRLQRFAPFSSHFSVARNVLSKIPTYEQAARILFSQVAVFVDSGGMLPKAKFAKKQ